MIPMIGFAQNTKSWKDIAAEYYINKDYNEAIKYYEKWLEADPNDNENWYNIACCYALINDQENTFMALDKAISLGWNNCKHLQNDTDLSNVYETERFKDILKNCDDSLAAQIIPNYEVKHALMSSIGTYGVLLPKNYDEKKEYPLLIWIHGHGSSEFYHAKLVEAYNIDNAIIIFPRAPYIEKAITEYNQKLGWTGNQTDNLSKENELYMYQGSLYVDWINNCITDVKTKYLIDEKNCIIFGHSQGAAYSLAYATMYPTKVKAAIAFAGGTSSKFKLTQDLIEQLAINKVNIELLHGVNDPVIKLAWTEELYKKLLEAKVNVNLTKIEAAHSFGDSQVAKETILQLIKSQLP